MSYQYSSEIVTTSTGEVDMEYYRLEANRLQSQKVAELLAGMFSFVKKGLQIKPFGQFGLPNFFMLGRLAK